MPFDGRGLEGTDLYALGMFPGDYYTKFGYNSSVSAAEDVWNGGGDYTGQPITGSAETVEVFSASASDTNGGTGLHSLTLYGLDANYHEQREDITLNGTTPVLSTKTWWRIYRAWGTKAGSAGHNVGAITARHSTTTANVFMVLPATFSQTQIAAITIPANHMGLIKRLRSGVSNNAVSAQEATLAIMTRDYGTGVWRVRSTLISSTNAPGEERPVGGIVLEPKTDVKIRVLSVTATLAVSARFDLIVVPEYGIDQELL